MTLSITKACHDEHLFRPFLADRYGSIHSWRRWMVAMRVLHGLPVRKPWAKRLIQECTGRDAALLPSDGFTSALFLTGRRSGKSRISSVAAAFEASLSGKESRLAKGEMGMVAVISPSKLQSQIVKSYLRALYETPLLAEQVIQEDREGFQLRNKVRIQILTGDFRSVRGFTLLASVVDEIAFFGLTEESKVKSDSELIRAVKPALATCGGRLIAISSPYARKGWTWQTYKKHHANDDGSILVWNCPSRTMNPLLPQSIVDEAMSEDLAAAKSEYLGEFRDDVSLWLPIEVIQQCVIAGRQELLARKNTKYVAFADLSGGRSDPAALAIAHKDGEKAILDLCRQWKPPFNPQLVIEDMSLVLRDYHLQRCTGDRYAAEFVTQGFRKHGVIYQPADKTASELYLDLLGRLCGQTVELLDDATLVKQLASLERRTRSGGRDVVDHPPGCHDDMSNAAAGAVNLAAKPAGLKIGFNIFD